jgi:hypothetical protein
MNNDFKVEGVEETIRALKRLNSDRDTRAILLAAMRAGATPLVKEARNQMSSIAGLKDRKDIAEIKRNVTKRVGRSKRFPTIIVGMRKPNESFQWYQRFIEVGTKDRRGRGEITSFFPLYRAAKIKGREAINVTLMNFLKKYNARARRMGFRAI